MIGHWSQNLVLIGLFFVSVSFAGEPIEVSGTGYPPEQRTNNTQARFMAKRAATLDAYRNALLYAGSIRNQETSRKLFGYIQGPRIVKEEYLPNGRVSIKVAVRPENLKMIPGKARSPQLVSLKEWLNVVGNLMSNP